MQIKNVTKKYGELVVLENFSVDFEKDKITCILGASGCGKTTLLNVIAGLTDYQGQVVGDNKISYIFQGTRLLKNLTVYKNLEYVLKNNGLTKEEIEVSITEMLKKVDLWDVRDKYPHQLSGGMMQRVSLSRAFVFNAPVLLMDEPFKGLDISLKKQIIELFQKLIKSEKKTTIFVTHDLEEAITLSDRILVMGLGGKIILDELNEHKDRNVLYDKIFKVL